MPSRYFNPNNYETYKGGGFFRDVASAAGRPVKAAYELINGHKVLKLDNVGGNLNNNLHANPRAHAVQAGGNDWMASNNSWGAVNTPSMSEAQFRMFNKTTPYMTNEQLAPGAVGGKAACIGKNPIYASNAFNGVPAMAGGARKRRKSRKSRKSRRRSRRR